MASGVNFILTDSTVSQQAYKPNCHVWTLTHLSGKKKASLCDSTGCFVQLCWQLERRWACLSDSARVSSSQWTHTELKLGGGDFKWRANRLPFFFTLVGWVMSWRDSKWRPLCPSLWWLTSLPPWRCWSFACRLSWPSNHSTCSGACYCPAHADLRGGGILLLGCQNEWSRTDSSRTLALFSAQRPVSVPKKRVEDKEPLEESAWEGSGVFSHLKQRRHGSKSPHHLTLDLPTYGFEVNGKCRVRCSIVNAIGFSLSTRQM